mmetsp:Transcript_51012/g.128037  ORF Transcript_51012/g.128037 Transcript_51012/m.128037 type:complete len:211 (-) Transcript_51012:60-692(-)
MDREGGRVRDRDQHRGYSGHTRACVRGCAAGDAAPIAVHSNERSSNRRGWMRKMRDVERPMLWLDTIITSAAPVASTLNVCGASRSDSPCDSAHCRRDVWEIPNGWYSSSSTKISLTDGPPVEDMLVNTSADGTVRPIRRLREHSRTDRPRSSRMGRRCSDSICMNEGRSEGSMRSACSVAFAKKLLGFTVGATRSLYRRDAASMLLRFL